ncbi:MAG: hypothetical protein H8D80_01320 [Proteobacteria bacterium]|nr:hypothetical protein [Pseudomonadota bacterium]
MSEETPLENYFEEVDFGFTMSDADSIEGNETDGTQSSESLQRLEGKVDSLIDAAATESLYRNKFDDIESLIIPLLYNLKKNPDKEYIYWPNREEKLQEQIDKIISITRS